MTVTTLALLIACVAFVFSMLSLGLLTIWRSVPPDLAETRTAIAQCNNEITDLADKYHHWVRRESVRRSREKREENEADGNAWPKSALTKGELRRLYGQGKIKTVTGA